jgi:membrane protease YdiL (CAAX protease family)
MRTEALLLVLASFLLLATLGGVLEARLGFAGVFASQLVCILAPTLLWVSARRLPLGELGMGRARPLGLTGGALAGLGAFYLSTLVETHLLERFMPMPREVREALRRVIVPPTGLRPLAVDLGVLALMPALCEELLFRGAVMHAYRARAGASALVSAVCFGAFHYSIYRFVPATLLGLVLAWLRLEGRSLWPVIAFHAVNNAAVIVTTRLGRDEPLPLSSGVGLFLLASAVAALTAGLGLIRRASQ